MILWNPSEEQQRATQMARFMERVSAEHRLQLGAYHELHRWSVEHAGAFWSLWWDEAGVLAQAKGESPLVGDGSMLGSRFFPQARLNFAENLLRFAQRPESRARTAVVACDETGARESWSFAELEGDVARFAAALRRDGVGVGDRVAGFVTNGAEALIAMLGCAAVGAIWSSTSSDFGVDGVVDRFGQIEPQVLVASTRAHYAGKRLDLHERVEAIAARLPTLRRCVVFGGATPQAPLATTWDAYLGSAAVAPSYEPLPFDHPLLVMYSSGTTGAPKAIVHGAGGTLLQQLKEHALHTDVRAGEVVFYYTTTGWMMWNWLVAALGVGATLLLYDGSPFHPGPEALWSLAEREGVAVFGTSAKYLSALEKSGYTPRDAHRLGSLRALLSTGSPLAPEGFEFAYRSIKSEMMLASISGGTDIISCFALGCPLRPVRAGELQCRGLGMAVEVWSEGGEPLEAGRGELVCTRPFPSMPLGFWNDPTGERYRAAYFERFAGVWAHGDYAERTAADGMIVHGRSDAVLNPGGVRIGTAEIYRVVEQLPEVLESICIGQPHDGDVRVVLFVRLRKGVQLDEGLRGRIRSALRERATPRHVPAVIAAVPDIPRTKSGKLVELAVRAVVMGEPVRQREALANPEALEHFADHPELRG